MCEPPRSITCSSAHRNGRNFGLNTRHPMFCLPDTYLPPNQKLFFPPRSRENNNNGRDVYSEQPANTPANKANRPFYEQLEPLAAETYGSARKKISSRTPHACAPNTASHVRSVWESGMHEKYAEPPARRRLYVGFGEKKRRSRSAETLTGRT
jgi:hypothetical protein